MRPRPYERFDAWRAAHAFALEVYRASRKWPPDERYGLRSQVRRAAFSITANIVEGQARTGKGEFRHFLDISWGSLSEVEYILRFAHDLAYLTDQEYEHLTGLASNAARPLFGLLRSMRKP